MASIEALLEAEKRGILPPEKAPFLAEARKRGIIPTPTPVSEETGALEQIGQRLSEVGGSLIKEVFPESISEPILGAAERAGERVAERVESIKETGEAFDRGDIGIFQAPIQVGGQIAGSALDVVSENFLAGIKTAGGIVPDSISEPVKQKASEAFQAFSQTDSAKFGLSALNSGIEAWQDFKTENPNAAKTIESAANIGLVAAPVAGQTLRKPAVVLERKAGLQVAKKRRDFVNDLVRPKQTAKERLAEVGRTEEKGILRKSVRSLSPRQKDIAKEVSRIKGVTSSRGLQFNYNQIVKENVKLAKALDKNIDIKKSVPLQRRAVNNSIDGAVEKLISTNPVIVGNAETVAKRVATKAKQILADNPSTPQGVFRSRKQLDSWIKSQKGQKAFDPSMENALSVSIRTIRQSMNDIVDKAVPSASVKANLRRQNLLFDAMDNVAEKAASQGRNSVARAFESLIQIVPLRNQAVQIAGTLAGVGIVGGSALFSPIIAAGLAAGGIIYAGTRALLSPAAKKGLAQLLRLTDKALVTTKEPSIIRALRADRAVIADIIKNSELIKEGQNGN